MRKPLRAKGIPRQQVATTRSVAAPLRGWNARDGLATMHEHDAVALDNFFPTTSYVELRGGSADHVTGIDGTPQTLAVYNALDGTSKMFASTATAVYDVTNSGVVDENAMVSPGASGDYAWTADSAAVSVTGDIDIRVKVSLTDWTPAAISTLVAKSEATANQRSYAFSVKTDGKLQFQNSPDGTAASLVTSASSVAPTVANGATLWVRVTVDVNDGAGGNVVTFYTSSNGTTWTALGTAVTNVGTTSIFDSTALLEVGSRDTGTTQVSAGSFYVAQVYSGIAGTLKAEFRANDTYAGDADFPGFATGETWTVEGSAAIVGDAVASRTNAQHQVLNYGDGTSNYLMMFNGTDKPLYFDGTAWLAVDASSSPALTGLTTTKIISAFASKSRLFFIEKDSLSFWYLAAGAAGGVLTEFPLDGVFHRGGYLVAGETWTFDGGDGLDDAVALVNSEGEIVVYKGTNPSSSTAWALVGRFDLAEPIGRRCLMSYGGDLLVITQSGVFPLSAALKAPEEEKARTAVSNRIENAFSSAVRSYGANFGWETVNFQNQSALVCNVPTSATTSDQYVMNTTTKAWCRFTNWNATTFAVLNRELYFSTLGKIVKAWTGTADGTNAITAYGKTAFSYFGSVGTQKNFTLYRPMIAVNGSLGFLTDIDVDFSERKISGYSYVSLRTGGVYDIDNWDESYWSSGIEISKNWTSPSAFPGYCAAGKLQVTTSDRVVRWIANDYVFISGGPL